MPEAPVTVVSVTYNSASLIPGFLTGLRAATEDVPHQLVVVDNASGDGTADLAAELAPDALVVRGKHNLGYAGGINVAIREAAPTGPVLVTNPDLRLHPGAVKALLAALSDPAVGIAVPQLRDDTGRLLFSLRRDPRILRILGEAFLGGHRAGRYGPLGEVVSTTRHYLRPRSVDWATGACMLISAECMRRVGPWNEDFFLYSEETDFALRTRDAGLRLQYVPSALASHRGGDAHTSPELFALLTMNRWRLYRARHGRAAGAAFRAALIVDTLPRAAAGRAPARAALSELVSPGADARRGSLQR
jgi:GT2 family glycosyltransferase